MIFLSPEGGDDEEEEVCHDNATESPNSSLPASQEIETDEGLALFPEESAEPAQPVGGGGDGEVHGNGEAIGTCDG